jgi:signal peptidase
MRKTLKIIYYAIVTLLIAVSLLLVASIFPVANLRVKSALSGSMEPAISVGSIIVIRSADEYKIDDIITFQFALNQPATTHRIVGTQIIEGTTYFITKGDANEEPDPRLVREEEVLGRVLFSVPLVGYAVNFVQQPLGFILLIVVPATIIISDEIRSIGREITNLKNNKKDRAQDKKIQAIKRKNKIRDIEIKNLKQAIIEMRKEKEKLKTRAKNYAKTKKNKSRAKQNR